MCGICGLATSDPRQPVEAGLIRRMAATLVHRGPDGEGVHAGPGVGLGVRRLAIVDLETGDQPIASEDGSVTVVCNGEIYNHVELRSQLERAGHRFRTRSDVETIVHLYEDEGLEFVHRLRGMFALALWDAGRRRLVLARDRLGIKPLVWSRTGGGLAFASEFKALLAGGLVEPALEPAAINDLFEWGWVLTPRSTCAGVRRLPPGHLLVFEDGRETIRRWWAHPLLSEAERPERREEEWAEGLLARLEEAVRLHLRSDVPVGAWLSGGIDSSGVAALAARILGRTVDTFSLEFEDPRYDEVGQNRTLDRFPGYDLRGHRTRYGQRDASLFPRGIWHGEELARSSGGLRQAIAALTAERVKVALAGEGADEMLGGYWWYLRDRRLRLISRMPGARWLWSATVGRGDRKARDRRIIESPVGPGPRRFQAAAGSPGTIDRSLYSPALARALAGGSARLPEAPPGLERRAPADWLQYWDVTTRMHDHIVQTLDRHTMAYSIEVRVPFLDHEVAEWCLSMPPALKEARPEKRVLRRALARDLPREILERAKRGLAGPSASWLREEPPAFVAELLAPEALRSKGWFDPAAVERTWRRARAGDAEAERGLKGVLQVQLWDEIFLQGRSPDDFDDGRAVGAEPVA